MLRSVLNQGDCSQRDFSRLRVSREYFPPMQFHPSGAVYHRTAGLDRGLVAGYGDCECIQWPPSQY